MERKRHLTTPVNNALCVLLMVNLLLAAATEETVFGFTLTVLFLAMDYVIYKILKRYE